MSDNSPALVDQSDGETFADWAAHPAVSEGDDVSVTFNNLHDKRFAKRTTETGEVTWADHDVGSAGHVALKLKTDERVVTVTNGRGVFVKRIGEIQGKNVGTVVDHELHGDGR